MVPYRPLYSLLGWALCGFLCIQSTLAQQPCSFSEEIPLDADGTVLMQQYVNYQEGTYSVRVRYTQGYSWIGIGINYYGDAYMVPAYAVIGRMEDDGAPSVGRYWLERTVVDGVLPIEDPNGHLKTATASFMQLDGETILEFTHDLIIMEEGIVYENVTSNSTWIWAVGPEDNDWGSRHRLQGSFSITLADTCADPEDSNGDDTIPVDLTPVDTNMTDVTDTNMTNVEDSGSTIVFNKSETRVSQGLWITHGIFMGLAWGLCAPLAIGASLFRNIGFLEKNGLWFKLHMYLNATVAFLTFIGFFLAVRATNKEGGQGHFKDETHHKVGLTIFLFVLAQCVLGYFRPKKEKNATDAEEEKSVEVIVKDNDNLSKDDSTILEVEPSEKAEAASASGEPGEEEGFELDMANINKLNEAAQEDAAKDDDAWSLFTPPPPPPEESQPTEADVDGQREVVEANDNAEEVEVQSTSSFKSFEELKQETSSDDSRFRVIWKLVHRILGVILLSLAWFNCHTGIVLYSEKYDTDNERQLLNVFWGFAATIAVIFLLQGYITRV
jgi:hypothetical protein